MRAFNHLGPGQTDKFVAPALASRIARDERDGGEVLKVGNLTARRDFTDVRDVVRAYRLLAERGEPGEAYNVCSRHRPRGAGPRPTTSSPWPPRPCASRPTPTCCGRSTVPVLRGSHEKLTAATGWEPEIPIEQTLADLLDDWRTRLG